MASNTKDSKNLSQVFSQDTRERIIKKVRLIGKMTPEETRILKNSPAGKILWAVPYFAGSKHPEIMVLYSLLSLLAMIRNPVFFRLRPGQTHRERIEPLFYCPGGDPVVVETAVSLMELISLNEIAGEENMLFIFNSREKLIKGLEKNRNVLEKYQCLFHTDILKIDRLWLMEDSKSGSHRS